jgi:hypothetical protein
MQKMRTVLILITTVAITLSANAENITLRITENVLAARTIKAAAAALARSLHHQNWKTEETNMLQKGDVVMLLRGDEVSFDNNEPIIRVPGLDTGIMKFFWRGSTLYLPHTLWNEATAE